MPRPRGYSFVAEFADEGISAHTGQISNRPVFAQMLAAAEARQLSIIVVHRRVPLRDELARLQETDVHGRPEALVDLQRYLLNAGAAWEDGDGEQRNKLARALFEAVMVKDHSSTVCGQGPRCSPS